MIASHWILKSVVFFLQINNKEFPLSDIEEGSDKDLSIQNQVCYILCLILLFLKQMIYFLLLEMASSSGGSRIFLRWRSTLKEWHNW